MSGNNAWGLLLALGRQHQSRMLVDELSNPDHPRTSVSADELKAVLDRLESWLEFDRRADLSRAMELLRVISALGPMGGGRRRPRPEAGWLIDHVMKHGAGWRDVVPKDAEQLGPALQESILRVMEYLGRSSGASS